MANDGERITVSLSTLRAELSGLELRLVDRMNAAMASKADIQVADQLAVRAADLTGRVTVIEQAMVRKDGPLMQKLEYHDQEISNLQAVSGYKRWLWAQTIALIAIAVPLGVYAIDRIFNHGGV